MTRRRRAAILAFVACAALAGVGLWLSAPAWLPTSGRWLDVGESPVKADYVMVLGGGPNIRPFAAAAIFRAGLAPTVLISHTMPSASDVDAGVPADVEMSRAVLRRRQVPDERIIAVGQGNASTHDEARALAAYLQRHPAQRVLIVTHDFHTRRAARIMRRCLAGQPVEVVMVSAPSERFRLDAWWRTEEGFVTVLGENLKLLAYLFL